MSSSEDLEDYYIDVSIKESLVNKLPFPPLPSKHATALILAYADRKDFVVRLLQVISHTGRAYYVKQRKVAGSAFNGFIVGSPDYC